MRQRSRHEGADVWSEIDILYWLATAKVGHKMVVALPHKYVTIEVTSTTDPFKEKKP